MGEFFKFFFISLLGTVYGCHSTPSDRHFAKTEEEVIVFEKQVLAGNEFCQETEAEVYVSQKSQGTMTLSIGLDYDEPMVRTVSSVEENFFTTMDGGKKGISFSANELTHDCDLKISKNAEGLYALDLVRPTFGQ